MKLTREHKLLLGVVVVGGLALGVDQLIPAGEAGPQTAVAQEPGESGEPAISPPTAEPDAAIEQNTLTPTLAPTGPSIASQLALAGPHHLDDTEAPRDAFVTDSAWFDDVPATSNATITIKSSMDKFLRQHTLSAVMNRHIAIVNGEPYKVGQSIVDFLLVSVDDNTATFEHQGKVVALTLHEPIRSSRR